MTPKQRLRDQLPPEGARVIDTRFRPGLWPKPSGLAGKPDLVIPPPVERIEDALREARHYGLPLPLYRWCYGIPVVTDPRDFYPDPWHCTRLELDTWMEAVQRWDRGEEVRFPAAMDERWGIGISLLRAHDDEYKDPSKPWKMAVPPEQWLTEGYERQELVDEFDPRDYGKALAAQEVEPVPVAPRRVEDREEWW